MIRHSVDSFQFGLRADAIPPCPGSDVEPSEIRPKSSRGEITKRGEDAKEGIMGITPTETSGEHPIEAASPRRAIREVSERRHPLEPPKDVRAGTNVPKNSDEGTAQRGGRVTTYKTLKCAGVIEAEGGSSKTVAPQVDGHTGAEHRGGELVREYARISGGDGRESAKPCGPVGRARRSTRAETNRGSNVAEALRIGVRAEGEGETKRDSRGRSVGGIASHQSKQVRSSGESNRTPRGYWREETGPT